ncbi:DUF805 domain-containing protein [Psychrobacter sanguinis]|uniref:DUF805 domain-containing protein n=1 Tax=Psychrobacter sanguinis TaxID=861445 RepID=UPI00020C942E|nr:DUF805 domain-containing protein [Psychrobacter sanguinis]EGK13324.1 inner membrane protein YhaH [Psychrobacter sp. 1501(2011)]MCC3308944.1 DUF805 domain-containing protein [Psychrobacter sanguinis]UEC26235.1 DUF805 domain-containing protein [Psychrobacter sanguinis]HBH33628.1 DUF805 domain-containing protein [Psychrobacter sp.]
MNWFFDAIKNRYADFDGRASRQEFWMFNLFYLLFVIAISLLIIPFGNSETGLNIIFGIIVVYSLGLAIPIWAVTVRRLHDIGLSGWWSLLSFIPYLGTVVLLIMCCMDSKPGSNKYGNNPKGL